MSKVFSEHVLIIGYDIKNPDKMDDINAWIQKYMLTTIKYKVDSSGVESNRHDKEHFILRFATEHLKARFLLEFG